MGNIFANQEVREAERLLWKAVMDQCPLEFLPLNCRAYNCLHFADDIHTMRDLVSLTEQDLMEIPSLGKKTVLEIKELLANFGLSLATNNQLTTNPRRII